MSAAVPAAEAGLVLGQARDHSSRALQPGSGSPGSPVPSQVFLLPVLHGETSASFLRHRESPPWEPRKGRPLFPLGVRMPPACPLPPCVGPGRPCLTASAAALSKPHIFALHFFLSCLWLNFLFALFSSGSFPCTLFLTIAKGRALSKFLIFVFKLALLFKFLSVSKARQNVKVYKHNRGLGKLCEVKTPSR